MPLIFLIRKVAKAGRGGYVEFKFSSASVYNTAVRRLFDDGVIYDVLSTARRLSGEDIRTDRVTYTENEGYNIITLKTD